MKYLIAICLLCAAALAQNTTVTATVVDPNSNPYANGTVSAFAVVATGQASPPPVAGTLNGSGAFSISLPSNLSYVFTVCAAPVNIGPRANPTPKQLCFASTPILVSGGSQDVGSTLNGLAPLLGPGGGVGGGGTGCIVNPADGGCAIAGSPTVDLFVGGVAGGTGWLFQLAAAGLNVKVPVNVLGTTAGVWSIGCGPDPGVGSGIAFTGPTSCTPYTVYMPANSGSGFWKGTNTANKHSVTFQIGIDAANDLFGIVPLAGGGTGNSTGSGALVALFPNFIRNGDLCCFWNGSAWINLGGNTSAGGTVGFVTENSGGSWSFTVSPLGTPVGGSGLNTRAVGRIYEGNGTGAELASALLESATGIDSTKPFSFNAVGSFQVSYATASASTNASIGATTMATAGSSGNTYRFTPYVTQTVLGTGCSTNTSVTMTFLWTDPNGSSQTSGGSSTWTLTISNNGALGTTTTFVGAPSTVRAKASTVLQYSTSYVIGTCTTGPSYQVYPILEQLN